MDDKNNWAHFLSEAYDTVEAIPGVARFPELYRNVVVLVVDAKGTWRYYQKGEDGKYRLTEPTKILYIRQKETN